MPPESCPFSTGVLSANGKTAGTAKITLRSTNSAKSARVADYTIGTPVAVVAENDDQLLVEAKGRRGWIQKKYYTPDGETDSAENQ